MANPSHEKGNVAELLRIGGVMANVMYNLAQRPGDPVTDRDVAVMDGLRREWDAARRATPPSPSTAPEVEELLRQFLRAAYPCCTSIDARGYQWSEAYLDEARAVALASRPAEVDDEGLPPLPNHLYHWNSLTLVTVEQYRQGQRDAVAADRARRGDRT